MNDLSKYLVDQILLEEKSPIKNVVVVYVGRFQPMHKGHHQVYEHLVKKFGRNNVFVGTSNKVQRPKSPFNFKEKREIMTTMFGIPRNKIVEVKNPYAPTEVLKKFNEEETAFVTVVGKKDASRLGGKYFDKWDGKPTHGYKEKGYIYVSPAFGNISGTETRNGLSVGSDEQRKSFFKDRAYGKYNEKIFRMITDKLNEGIEISKETIEDWLISESSKLAIGHVDDGPVFWLPNLDLFGEINVERATKIGYEVVSKILNKELEDYYEHPIYPNGPVPTTTWFPAGVIGDRKNTNVLDIYTNKAYTKWYAHVTRQMALTGYQLVQTQLEKDNLLQDKEDSVQNAQNAKELEKEFENSLDENIKIPVKVGDTILTGRFKNKKVVVKNIGKDEHGMPTINGKKVVTFRLMKEQYIAEIAGTSVDCQMCEHSWDIDEKDPHPYLCHNCGYDNQKLEYDYDGWNKWKESEGIKEQKRVEFYESHFKNLVPSNFSVSKEDNNIKISIPSKITEMSIQNLDKIEKYAEKQLSPEDIEFTRHFFDRLNDPRNGKEISDAELVGFFKRLSRFKKKFKEFLEKYEQIVVKDKRSNINIPFLKQANQIIAKTIMRKSNFKTSNPTLAFEVGVGTGQSGVRMGYPSKDDLKKRMKDVEDQRKKTDSDKEFQYKPIKEDILTEGGAYGHMNHPFDTDINLTFGDLKDIVNRALEGTLEFTREKTDGQALAISWRDDRGLIAARNKSHLKNQGKGALDINGVSAKFQGRGGLTDAYNFAMKDLTKAISSLSSKQRDKIFKQGSCFMNLEVIWPTSVNVIPYGQALLVFHGTMEYDEDGKAIGENTEAARILAGMIKQINQDVQDSYTIKGPPVLQLPKSQDLSKKKAKYTSQISKLQKEFGLKNTDGVADYHQAWWEQWIDKNTPKPLDNKTKMGLVKRWAFMDKSFRLDNKNITDSDLLDWAKKHEKGNHKKIAKDNLMKFEQIFLGLGAEVLEFTSSALTVNPDKAVRDIKKRIDKTIKDVKKSGDPKKIEKLKLELTRLNSIGGKDKIVPNEGIVFLYKGNTFKLTGTFASVNQILGIFF